MSATALRQVECDLTFDWFWLVGAPLHLNFGYFVFECLSDEQSVDDRIGLVTQDDLQNWVDGVIGFVSQSGVRVKENCLGVGRVI